MWERSPRGNQGVAREGKVHARDVSNCYLRSDGRALGVEGLALIDTTDAVLVAPIERSHATRSPPVPVVGIASQDAAGNSSRASPEATPGHR